MNLRNVSKVMPIIDEKNFKILFASENINYRNNLAAKLRFEGFNVEIATGGFHIIHLVEKNNDYNLIFIHENMQDMSGYEIISLLRNTKSKKDLPIIYISKDKREEEVCEIVFAGANEFLTQSTNFSPILEIARKIFIQLKQA
jgi:PleD family two-component response regulator